MYSNTFCSLQLRMHTRYILIHLNSHRRLLCDAQWWMLSPLLNYGCSSNCSIVNVQSRCSSRCIHSCLDRLIPFTLKCALELTFSFFFVVRFCFLSVEPWSTKSHMWLLWCIVLVWGAYRSTPSHNKTIIQQMLQRRECYLASLQTTTRAFA